MSWFLLSGSIYFGTILCATIDFPGIPSSNPFRWTAFLSALALAGQTFSSAMPLCAETTLPSLDENQAVFAEFNLLAQ
jgi:hypothetical protein